MIAGISFVITFIIDVKHTAPISLLFGKWRCVWPLRFCYLETYSE